MKNLFVVMFWTGIACIAISLGMTGYVLFNPQLSSKLFKIVLNNPNFWLLLSLGIGFSFWRKYKKPIEFTRLELGVQIGASFVLLLGLSSGFLMGTAGLHDTEYWNGHVRSATYYEEWTEEVTYYEEECTGTGENRVCRDVEKTRYDYHAPEWIVTTSNGESVSISSREYRNYVDLFGNEEEMDIVRIDQSSFGDGDKYVTVWQGSQELMVSTAVEHTYVNYLKASRSLTKRSGVSGPYQDLILDYPELHSVGYGEIELNRVLLAGVDAPNDWVQLVDRQIDLAMATLGAEQEVNCLVYLVDTSDRGFLHSLEEEWCYGKKNDVIVVVGVDNFPQVDWSGIMIFSGNEELKVQLRDAIESLGNISDPQVFATLVIDNIKQHFKRVSMSELEYLIYDVDMPWWAVIIMIFVFVVTLLTITAMFENNNIRS